MRRDKAHPHCPAHAYRLDVEGAGSREYRIASTAETATRPSSTIVSSTGMSLAIFSAVSMMLSCIGASFDRLQCPERRIRLPDPYPSMPRKTIASAIPSSSHRARTASWRGLPSQRSSSPKWMRNMRAENSCFIAISLRTDAWIARRPCAFVRRSIGVLDNVDVRKHNKPFFDHLLNQGQNRAEFFRRVDGREHDRAVV